MSQTYKAVEVTSPGTLRVVERPIPEPGAGQGKARFRMVLLTGQ